MPELTVHASTVTAAADLTTVWSGNCRDSPIALAGVAGQKLWYSHLPYGAGTVRGRLLWMVPAPYKKGNDDTLLAPFRRLGRGAIYFSGHIPIKLN